MDLLCKQKRGGNIFDKTEHSSQRVCGHYVCARIASAMGGVVTFSTKRNGRNFSGSFRQIGDFFVTGSLCPTLLWWAKETASRQGGWLAVRRENESYLVNH